MSSYRNRHHQQYIGAALILVLLAILFAYPPALNVAKMQGGPTGTEDPNTAFGGMNVNSYFTDLSFSITPDGPAMNYFAGGTTQIYARWNYINIGPEARVTRHWYLNGQLFINRSDPWTYGANGRLNSISIFDFSEGLTPGYWHVVIFLEPQAAYPAAVLEGDFVIADYQPGPQPIPNGQPAFSNLTMSSSAAGATTFQFPAGTPLVSARWDYANIPIGALMVREWYRYGVLFHAVEEAWSANWGSSGRLTHVALYDYQNGLQSGDYQLRIYLKDRPDVQASVAFSIGQQQPGAGYFYNLTFSTSADGQAQGIFYNRPAQIFARWDFANVTNFVDGVTVQRRWYRNGVLWLTRNETWTYGVNGHINNVSIYDFYNGLLPGSYYVEIELLGVQGSLITGTFEIR
ncbi:MAG: hypothetical protein U0528_06940 [Anaerolineae bacterium]